MPSSLVRALFGSLVILAATGCPSGGGGGGNAAPVPADDTATTLEDTPVVVDVLANDVEPDDDLMTIVAVGDGASGTVSVLFDGDLEYAPDPEFFGTDTFTYTVSDGEIDVDAQVTVTVTVVGDSPIALDDDFTLDEDQALVIPAVAGVLGNDADVDSTVITAVLDADVVDGTLVLSADGSFTYTPDADFVGADSFTYHATDGIQSSAVVTVGLAVAAVNDAPVAVNDPYTTNEDTALVVPAGTGVLANDSDVENDAITAAVQASPTNGMLTLAANGSFTYTPNANFNGADSFTYRANDGAVSSSSATVTITVNGVNDAPVAVDDNVTTNEDSVATIAASTLTANDSEVDGQALTVSAVSNAVNGVVSLSVTTITFTPDANFNGTAGFDYTVSDGTLTDTGHVTVTVTAVNDVPVASAASVLTNEDTPLLITLTGSDLEGGSLTFAIGTGPTAGSLGSITPVSATTASVTYTPSANSIASDSFTFTVNDGTDTSAPATVTIDIVPVDDAPVAVDDNVTTNEDSVATIAASTLTANDSEVDGQALTVSAVSNAVNGVVSLSVTTITFTPTANFNGTAGFDYTVTDGALPDTGHVTVTVAAIDDFPVSSDDALSVNEDVSGNVAVLANDTGLGDGGIVVVVTSQGAKGVAVVNGDLTIAYTPSANENGADSFDYLVIDGDGDSSSSTVTVDIVPVNDPPVAVNDFDATNVDIPIIQLATLYTSNDTDADLDTLAITAVQNAINGVVVFGAGTITFTPSPAFVGTASYEYVVSDGQGGVDTGLVSITVSSEPACGNGAVEAGEQCDDFGMVNGDGCSNVCQEETGWTCTGSPSECGPICNDGLVLGLEECDDGDPFDTNGCTTACRSGPVCDGNTLPGGDAFVTDPANGTCYASFDADPTTFGGAYTGCVDVGGHLATITNSTEQTFVHGIQLGIPWIGASDDANDTDAVFDWVTTESWGFTNFMVGEPDDDAGVGGNGECLALLNAAGEWGDTDCNFLGFTTGRVCEVEQIACGDGIVQATRGEQCDDGNANNGDACDDTCQFTPGKLLLVEIDYEQAGPDTAEFLEIQNVGGSPISLAVFALVLVNGVSDAEYLPSGRSTRIQLSEALDGNGTSVTILQPAQRLVVAGSGVAIDPSALRIVVGASGNLQNGETTNFNAAGGDAVGILNNDLNQLVDALSYEGNVTAPFDFTEGTTGLDNAAFPSPDEASDGSSSGSLVRVSGSDTNNPNTDWTTAAAPTPGS